MSAGAPSPAVPPTRMLPAASSAAVLGTGPTLLVTIPPVPNVGSRLPACARAGRGPIVKARTTPSATVIGKILTDICYKFAPNYGDKL